MRIKVYCAHLNLRDLKHWGKRTDVSVKCHKSSGEVGRKGKEVRGPDHPQEVLPQNWGGTEQNRAVTCMVLKAKANDKRKNLVLSRNEFRGYVTVDKVA
ncbi:hypothetical protein TNCV_1974471 [Trichonephila clavipes]|nr:hypothetical protein TNCV_1974471 [Trichonephila clavipes]